jgi:hypothetical protein
MDSGVSALTAAAKAAVEQYGAGEDGCLCQVATRHGVVDLMPSAEDGQNWSEHVGTYH